MPCIICVFGRFIIHDSYVMPWTFHNFFNLHRTENMMSSKISSSTGALPVDIISSEEALTSHHMRLAANMEAVGNTNTALSHKEVPHSHADRTIVDMKRTLLLDGIRGGCVTNVSKWARDNAVNPTTANNWRGEFLKAGKISVEQCYGPLCDKFLNDLQAGLVSDITQWARDNHTSESDASSWIWALHKHGKISEELFYNPGKEPHIDESCSRLLNDIRMKKVTSASQWGQSNNLDLFTVNRWAISFYRSWKITDDEYKSLRHSSSLVDLKSVQSTDKSSVHYDISKKASPTEAVSSDVVGGKTSHRDQFLQDILSGKVVSVRQWARDNNEKQQTTTRWVDEFYRAHDISAEEYYHLRPTRSHTAKGTDQIMYRSVT